MFVIKLSRKSDLSVRQRTDCFELSGGLIPQAIGVLRERFQIFAFRLPEKDQTSDKKKILSLGRFATLGPQSQRLDRINRNLRWNGYGLPIARAAL